MIYVKCQIERLAFEIYLNRKYKRNIKEETLLQDILHSSWHLTIMEEKILLEDAIKLANDKYFENKV